MNRVLVVVFLLLVGGSPACVTKQTTIEAGDSDESESDTQVGAASVDHADDVNRNLAGSMRR
jgi:hypothetical protein